MAAALLIPLLATEGGTALLGALGAGVGGYLAGQAIKNTFQGNRLTRESNSTQYVTAVDNYMKSEQDFEASRAKGLGGLAEADAGREIAKNYDYVEWDEQKYRLAVATDQQIAAGGDLSVSRYGDNLNIANNNVSKDLVFDNYGTAADPVAMSGTYQVALSEDGTIPYVNPDGPAVSSVQRVAQSVLEAEKIGDNDLGIAAPRVPPSSDVITGELPNVSQAPDPVIPQAPTKDFVDPALDAEMAREASRGRAWSEDSTSSILNEQALTDARTMAQAQALDRAEADAIGSTAIPAAAPPPYTTANEFTGENPGVNGQDKPKSNTGGVVSRSVELPQEKPNPLHGYANYTYKISIYAVPRSAMNQVTNGKMAPGGEDGLIKQSDLVLSSGGSRSSDKGQYFGVDFFIDNLVMKSVVGVSAKNRSTDVVELNFDIIEPYNVTLVPRLVATSMRLTGKPDWASLFFLMKIQFLGYDDNGMPVNIPKTTKYVPFSLTNIEFDVSQKGAVYRVKAVPCQHMSQTPLDNVIPFHMEVNGGTIDEIFNSGSQLAGATSQNSATNPDRAAGEAAGTTAAASGGAKQGAQTFSKGVAAALNEGEKYLVKNKKQTYENTYAFEFAPELANAKVVDPQTYNTQGLRYSNKKDPKEQKQEAPPKIDQSKNVFRMQAGTRITDLVASILQVSTYMTDQWSQDGGEDKPLHTFKIIPFVEFGDMDPLTNMWQRKITYYVQPYTIYGQDHPHFGQKSPPGAVKRFKWIYTGQSKDVIDVKINYKVAFFEIKNGAENALLDLDNADDASKGESKAKKQGIFPGRTRPVFGIADMSNTGPRALNAKTLSIEELFKKQFDTVGDNVKLDITIVGDPDLIQQDNIFYGRTEAGKMIYDHGSVNYTHYESYFWLDFKSPMSDYDDDTGLFDLSESSGTNVFSGLYRIVQVSSEFRNGKFTQKLENYRVKTQSNQGQQASRSGNTNQPTAEKSTNGSLIVQDDASGVDAAVARNQEDNLQKSVALDRAEQAMQNTKTATTEAPKTTQVINDIASSSYSFGA